MSDTPTRAFEIAKMSASELAEALRASEEARERAEREREALRERLSLAAGRMSVAAHEYFCTSGCPNKTHEKLAQLLERAALAGAPQGKK